MIMSDYTLVSAHITANIVAEVLPRKVTVKTMPYVALLVLTFCEKYFCLKIFIIMLYMNLYSLLRIDAPKFCSVMKGIKARR